MKGKASGAPRTYQEFCRDVIRWLHEEGGFIPYRDDGVDVAIDVDGTTVTFDVALKDERGRVLVAECKRWRDAEPVEQGDMFKLKGQVDGLRLAVGADVEVGALFIASSGYRIGALRAAAFNDIEALTCAPDQSLPEVAVIFKRYDAGRDVTVQDARKGMAGELRMAGEVEHVYIPGAGRRAPTEGSEAG